MFLLVFIFYDFQQAHQKNQKDTIDVGEQEGTLVFFTENDFRITFLDRILIECHLPRLGRPFDC